MSPKGDSILWCLSGEKVMMKTALGSVDTQSE